MIAEAAGKLVAGFIDKQWPEDREEIFQILTLGVNKAWQEGKWKGMTAEFFCNVHRDVSGQPYIIAPDSHPILQATNFNGQPTAIRDKYFMFHRNGNGDIRNSVGCSWNTDVYTMGEFPTLPINNINLKKGFRVGVRAIGPAGDNEEIYINGTYLDGERVYSYTKNDLGATNACTIKEIDTVNGVRIAISNKFNFISNITFDKILSINKTATRTPIEVVAIDCEGEGHLLARLGPNQKRSAYRKYLVPDKICNWKTFHGIFKIAQQEEILNPSDPLIITNQEALICFAKGIHQMYWKEQAEMGAMYIIQGISILEKEKREDDTPTEFPIQVSGVNYEDLPHALRYNS